jgi:hypothetical protein
VKRVAAAVSDFLANTPCLEKSVFPKLVDSNGLCARQVADDSPPLAVYTYLTFTYRGKRGKTHGFLMFSAVFFTLLDRRCHPCLSAKMRSRFTRMASWADVQKWLALQLSQSCLRATTSHGRY